MPRRKLSEHRTKSLISEHLGLSYLGWSVRPGDSLVEVDGCDSYVVKVDQAIKGRFKKGLVFLDVKKDKLAECIKSLESKGYNHFIVEPYIKHNPEDERYLSISYGRDEYRLSYTSMGGVDVESHRESIVSVVVDDKTDWSKLAKETGLAEDRLRALLKLFMDNFFVFLEINPYTIHGDGALYVLDAAVEIDDAGMYFTQRWSENDIRSPSILQSNPHEEVVRALDAKSPASFNLNILNQDGSIFLLLSGGGASVVVADEVYNRGLGKALANYGEYSGNPTAYETYIYATEILQLMLSSTAPKKVLFIGGAVANFTDIASTFAGVIKALSEYAEQLEEQGVKVFVRRGGPRQEIGLAKIQTVLEEYGLCGGVYDPSTSITGALDAALKEIV